MSSIIMSQTNMNRKRDTHPWKDCHWVENRLDFTLTLPPSRCQYTSGVASVILMILPKSFDSYNNCIVCVRIRNVEREKKREENKKKISIVTFTVHVYVNDVFVLYDVYWNEKTRFFSSLNVDVSFSFFFFCLHLVCVCIQCHRTEIHVSMSSITMIKCV